MQGVQIAVVIFVLVNVGESYYLRSKHNYYYNKACNNSNECGEDSCCRDNNGNVIGTGDIGGGFGFELLGQNGRCRSKKGENGTICTKSCGCKEGLTCYRRISGACCLPQRCYDSKWVIKEEEYWRNCKPPKCFFPPMAPPSMSKLLK